MAIVSRTFLLSRAELEDLDTPVNIRRDIIQLGGSYSARYSAVSIDGVREVISLSDQEETTSEAANQLLLQDTGLFILSSTGRGLFRALLNQYPDATHIQLTVSGAIRPNPGSSVFPPTTAISPRTLQDEFEKRDLQDNFILDHVEGGLGEHGESIDDLEQEIEEFKARESQLGRRVDKLNFADSADLRNDRWTLVVRAATIEALPLEPDDIGLFVGIPSGGATEHFETRFEYRHLDLIDPTQNPTTSTRGALEV